MLIPRSTIALIAATLLLSACSYNDTSLSGTAAGGTVIPIKPAAGEAGQPVTATPLGGAGVASTGTLVGQKVQSVRGDLDRLRDSVTRHEQEFQQARGTQGQNAATYFGIVAGINSKLQVGTTPGNPQLVAQWNQAQSTLDRMGDDTARLNSISNEVASDSSFGAYLLDETRAALLLQGAVDEDHRQLRLIQTETTGTMSRIDQLLNSLSTEVSRQSNYISNERSNLVTLSLAIQNGQLYGPSLASRSFAPAAAMEAPAPLQPRPRAAAPIRSSSAADQRPLVIIRFDRPDVAYEQPLYTAVSRALERRPAASFEIVAVAPNAGTSAQVAINSNTSRQNAENVMRSLTNMGLPADRISLSATMSPDVQSTEVRLFVR